MLIYILITYLCIYSLGCGATKSAVSDTFYNKELEFITAKNRAEKDLRMYTNLVRIIHIQLMLCL